MNILGIIAEYNPFHNGHKYHLEEAKLKSNSDFVVVVMSGSFTQQGNISVLNKFDRAKLAIDYGADLVLELPTIHATSSSENFCFGAINILNSLGCITHLGFGAECENLELLKHIAITLLEKEKVIVALTKEYLKNGLSSAKARDLALKEVLDSNEYKEIEKPNNILGLEYLKCLYKLNSIIVPVIVKRKSAEHGDTSLLKSDTIASATAIRKAIDEGDLNNIKKLVPDNCFSLLSNNHLSTNSELFEIIRYEILKLGKSKLSNIYEVAEGLENRIYNAAITSENYEDLIMNIKSKRYTLGRIKRILIYIVLGITKNVASSISEANYARILKISNKGKELLKIINKFTTISVLSNISEKHLRNLESTVIESLNLDVLASNILSSICVEYLNKDYTNLID